MKVMDIIKVIEGLAPKSYAYEWDNVGLQVGKDNNTVNNVLIALELNLDILNEAIKKDVDLIIVHHPFIFSPIKSLDLESLQGKIIEGLIKNNISLYCAHTNIDIAKNGLNDYLMHKLNIDNTTILQREIEDETKEVGIGRVGYLKEEKIASILIEEIKNKLNIDKVRFIGDINKNISKVAVLNGSGADFIKKAYDNNVDIFITGDIKYHDAQSALDLSMPVLDIGHFESEIIFIDFIHELLSKEFKDINIKKSKEYTNPFLTM